jgi:hypothetical protein
MQHSKPVLFDLLIKWLECGVKLGEISRSDVIYRYVRDAALFWFPAPAHVGLPKHIKSERIEWLKDNLYLPFPVTAIEDPATLTLFSDHIGGNRDLLRGSAVDRSFIDMIPRGNRVRDDTGFRDPEMAPDVDDRSVIISTGCAKFLNMDEDTFIVEGEVRSMANFDPDTGKSETLYLKPKDRSARLRPEIEQCTLQNVGMSLQALCVLCDPDFFILENAPVAKPNPFPKRKKWVERESNLIKRVDSRPLYTVLKPCDIRKAMHLPDPDDSSERRGSPRPHERRAHSRRLMSERFTKMRGKTISIKSVWIGPEE